MDRILAEIARVIQSNDALKLDKSITVNILHVDMPYGGTGRKGETANLEKYLTNRRAIVRIQNKDDLCLCRAIVVAKALSTMRNGIIIFRIHEEHYKFNSLVNCMKGTT